MNEVPPRWTIQLEEVPHAVLATMRETGHHELHNQLVNFLRPLATEIGADVDKDLKLPGLPIGGGRYSLEVPFTPVLLSYVILEKDHRVVVTDLIWLHTG